MEMKIDAKIVSYAGFGLMVLALLVPFAKIPLVGGLGLIFDMGKLGEISALGYILSILAIAVTAYAGYVTFASPKDYMKAAFAGAAAFLILFIGFYLVRSSLNSQTGGFLTGMMGQMFRMGFASWLYLLGAVAFYFSAKGIKPITLKAPELKQDETGNKE